jgi:Cd2+/Zn2+-exporting ATPase
LEDSFVCQHCATEEARRNNEVGFQTKYVVSAFSAVMLTIGLFLEFTQSVGYWKYVFFLASMLSAGRWVIPRGIRSALGLHLDMNFLMTFAAFAAVIIGAPAEGAAALFLFYIAELLEDKAAEKARKELHTLVELEPPSIAVKTPTGEICKNPDSVEVGEIIIVRPGSRIGLDGIVSTGISTVNQAPITGESLPVPKSVGDEVFAGTINQEGYLEIEVTKKSSDSVLSRIIELVEESKKNRAPTERFVSRFSHIYTPIVVFASVLLVIFSFFIGLGFIESIRRGLTLLVISCPCAFVISIPVSMVSSITGSARNGVLVKGGRHIEMLSKAKTIAFDKTGTLTKGQLSVAGVCIHSSFTEEEILAAAIGLEKRSEHPIAHALLNEAEVRGIKVQETEEYTAVPGRGIIGQIDGRTYLVGNKQLLDDHSVDLGILETHSCGSGTMIYVVEEQKHLGTVVMSDTVREESKTIIQSLIDMGIHTVMLTGDNEDAAKQVAEALSFEEYESGLLPHEKVQTIERLRQNDSVIMVGDGINDAPALAAADVGIAMGVIGSDAALESSDVALMENNLSKVPSLIQQSKKTMKIIKQNVVLSIGLKLILAVLAIFGLISLWIAIGIGDMGLSLLVISNALRLVQKESSLRMTTHG